MFSVLKQSLLVLCAALAAVSSAAENSTFYNPVLPGWHSDPSCVSVDGTFYCVTSSFITFPGLPIYASKDLINWKLISHAWNREEQMPGASAETKGQQEGFYAATIRHHDGEFWVVCEWLGLDVGMLGTIFKSSDPFDDGSWSQPITFLTMTGDLDLFWDDDGKLYVPAQGAVLQEVDLEAGEVVSRVPIWSGTGGVWPEGPHIYRKDGWYYISLAEGGTELGHYQVMARSRNLTGPYDPCPYNPVLTNKGTDEYFQTVGHADLFQDLDGNWWGTALATRSGPEWTIYPMGRETVLYPVTWREGEWPILEPVRGKMSGWTLPNTNKDLPGIGPYNSDPDVYDFEAGSTLPRNLIHWRVPPKMEISANGGLHLVPTRANLTGNGADLDGRTGLSFIARPQIDTLFSFTVDIKTSPTEAGHEAGVTLFLTQKNHADLGVVLLPRDDLDSSPTERFLRFRVTGDGFTDSRHVQVPSEWGQSSIRFEISTANTTHYNFQASSSETPDAKIDLGVASAKLVSGQTGPFTGALIGAYTTCNGAGSGDTCPDGGDAYLSRWRYTGKGQYYTETDVITVV